MFQAEEQHVPVLRGGNKQRTCKEQKSQVGWGGGSGGDTGTAVHQGQMEPGRGEG